MQVIRYATTGETNIIDLQISHTTQEYYTKKHSEELQPISERIPKMPAITLGKSLILPVQSLMASQISEKPWNEARFP
jgi:hypothetical protein